MATGIGDRLRPMEPIVRGWIAVADRAIDGLRGSLDAHDVAALRGALPRDLARAFEVLGTFESGSRSERLAAAGRLVEMFGDEAGDLGAVEAGLVREAIQDCCERVRIDAMTARRLGALAHGYSLQLSSELHRVAAELDPDCRSI